jgi:hypothetical protein
LAAPFHMSHLCAVYSPQITSWFPQGIPGSANGSNVRYYPRENIRPSKKEMDKAVTILELPDVYS